MQSDPLADKIEEAKDLGRWVERHTNEREIRDLTDRQRIGVAMLQHSLDIVDGTLILLDHRLLGAALALARPTIEAYVRGIWALYCANEEAISGFWRTGRPTPWQLSGLTAVIRSRELEQAPWVDVMMSQVEQLNDLVHGGRHHFMSRIQTDTIEPRYSPDHGIWLVNIGIETRIRIACELFDVLSDARAMQGLHSYVSSKFDRSGLRVSSDAGTDHLTR